MKTSWVIGILVIALALVFGAALLRPSTPTAGTVPAVVADDHVKGATSSPVVLVEYLDFECAACGAYYPIIKRLEADYGDRVTFVARHFPLAGHRNGMTAALAAEAASRQGKFWEMHDLLFTRQNQWGGKQVETPEVFEGFAQELGLNMDQYRADVSSAEVRARVERDMQQGSAAGVRSTPTFFLNGSRIQNTPEEGFRQLLDQALQAR